MRLRILIEFLLALVLTFAAALAIAQMAKASSIMVTNAYARASLGAAKTSVVYFTLINETPELDRLRSVSVGITGRAELHRHVIVNDVAKMAAIACLVVPAGGEIAFAPGGLHVMLLDLASPLLEGTEFPLKLGFEKAGEVAISVPVKSATAGAEHHHAAPANLQFCD